MTDGGGAQAAMQLPDDLKVSALCAAGHAARRAARSTLNKLLYSTNGGTKRLEVQMEASGARLKGYRNLMSIKGIGAEGAAILLGVIGEVNDFASEAKLASYFGIVPRVANSNERVQHGRITKRGSKLGRTCLVQCTLIAKQYSPYLRQYYEKMKGKKGSGKAIIATARKFLGIIYRTLKNEWVFEDFPNFALAES